MERVHSLLGAFGAHVSVSKHPMDKEEKHSAYVFKLTPVSCFSATLPAAKMCEY